jgi:hypothetical protein
MPCLFSSITVSDDGIAIGDSASNVFVFAGILEFWMAGNGNGLLVEKPQNRISPIFTD